MNEETEIKPSEESENEESNSLGQDDISSLIDEMQKEKNSPEAKDEVEKSTGEATEKDPDGIKDDNNEGMDSNDLNQDDISKLIDEVQTDAKSSEAEDKEDKAEQGENDNEGEKSTESEKPSVGSTQPNEIIDEKEKKTESEELAKSQERDEKAVEEEGKFVEEDKESGKGTDNEDKKKENDDINNNEFNGLDPDEEIKIEGEPEREADPETGPEDDAEPDTPKEDIDKEDDDSKNKKNNEDKESENDDDNGQAVKLKEVKNSPKGKRFKLFIISIVSVAFVLVMLGLFTFFLKKPGSDHDGSVKPFQPEQTTKPESKSIEDLNVQLIKNDENNQAEASDSIFAKLDEITALKDELVVKENEIADLIKIHKNGVSEMEDEILWVKQNNQIESLDVAINNKKIEFGMMTIQRHLAYIEKIEPPYRWLNQGIEELLYLKRKIKIDSKVSRVISGVDMDKMIREIDTVKQSYRRGMDNLKIDMKNIEFTPFEVIWQRIIDKEKLSGGIAPKDNSMGEKKKTASGSEEKRNRIIWEEFCRGDFKRKNEMTALSTGAAKCLSKWKHADLIINGLSELSPTVAGHLLKWKGNWICLNGVKELSPEAAKHLFQWQGNWISLNGLSQISPGIVKHLAQWQGKQLELMGLKYQKSISEKVGFRALAKWEKSGGKLYIPDQIRKVIKKF